MLYHWSGKRTLQNAVVHRKRLTLLGGKACHYSFDIRRWITPADDDMMRAVWEKVARRHRKHLAQTKRRYANDARAKAVWHFVVEKIRFIPDEGKDFWQLPEETIARLRGDCEDKSFLTASLLLAAGIPQDRVRVVVGGILHPKPRAGRQRLLGHAWPIYRNSSGTWCILETNLRHLPIRGTSNRTTISKRPVGIDRAVLVSVDRVARDGRHAQYVPLFCFNKQAVWSVEESEPGRVDGAGALHPDWSKEPTFHHLWIRKQRLPTHGIDPHLFADLLQ